MKERKTLKVVAPVTEVDESGFGPNSGADETIFCLVNRDYTPVVGRWRVGVYREPVNNTDPEDREQVIEVLRLTRKGAIRYAHRVAQDAARGHVLPKRIDLEQI